MTFATTRLVGSRVMVKGTDVFGTEGQTVVDSTQWDEVNATTEYDQATEAFEAAVLEFFAPITEAAEELNSKMKRPDDPASYVVLKEAVEGVAAEPAQLVRLTKDSVILRLIEQGDTDRLVWVGDELEVTEASVRQAPAEEPTA